MATQMMCDACEKVQVVRGHDNTYLGPEFDWIRVEANEDSDHGLLCSWDCLATWAAFKAAARSLTEEGDR